jgi:RHS repeat-associated protein
VERYAIDRDQIAFVTDEQGNETFHYLYGLNVDQVLAQDSPTGMVWSLSDRLGSIDLLIDASGNVVDKCTFDSFGNLLEQTNPLVAFRYGYTAREFDAESGLYFYRARYYDPGIGRFISVDPMSFEAGDTNLYRYVFNSPTQWTDPSGKILPLLGIMAVGALVFGGYNAIHQGLEIAEGSRKEFSIGEVAGSMVLGAFAAPVLMSVAVPAWVTASLTVGGAAMGAYNMANGKPLSGALDVVAGLGGFFIGGGGGSSGLVPQLVGGGKYAGAGALTGKAAAGLIGVGIIGGGFTHGVSDIFQHFLAMSGGNGSSNADNQPGGSSQSGNNGNAKSPIDRLNELEKEGKIRGDVASLSTPLQ